MRPPFSRHGLSLRLCSYDPWTSLLPFPVSRYHADRKKAVVFWLPSARAWKAMLWTAGFERIEERGRFKMRAQQFTVPHLVLHAHKAKA